MDISVIVASAIVERSMLLRHPPTQGDGSRTARASIRATLRDDYWAGHSEVLDYWAGSSTGHTDGGHEVVNSNVCVEWYLIDPDSVCDSD
jgi:hypothetical protein